MINHAEVLDANGEIHCPQTRSGELEVQDATDAATVEQYV